MVKPDSLMVKLSQIVLASDLCLGCYRNRKSYMRNCGHGESGKYLKGAGIDASVTFPVSMA